ncbi:MAG: hypothetical protein GY711_35725 [bacterium]|nr:hypothetical protein [bacterium]
MAEAAGLGQGQYANVGRGYVPIADSVHITLRAEGILAGAVHDDAGQTLAGVSVSLRPEEVPDSWVHESIRTQADEAGEFRIEGLAAGSYSLSATTADRRWVLRPRPVEIEAGTTREVGLDMGAPVRVAGQVIDAVTGKPVARATVIAIEPHEYGTSPNLDHDISDKSGAFELWVPPGRVALYFGGKPSAYAYPEPQIVERFTASATEELEEFVLSLKPVGDE